MVGASPSPTEGGLPSVCIARNDQRATNLGGQWLRFDEGLHCKLSLNWLLYRPEMTQVTNAWNATAHRPMLRNGVVMGFPCVRSIDLIIHLPLQVH
jgi:hypothetical protein